MFRHCEFSSTGAPYLKTKSYNGRDFILIESLSFISVNHAIEYVAPIGATSDGASTPPIIWQFGGKEFLPPFGDYWPAAFFHDGAYQNWLLKRTPDNQIVLANLSKIEADNLLLEIMEHLQVSIFKREAIYEGVNKGGFIAFSQDRQKMLTLTNSFSSLN